MSLGTIKSNQGLKTERAKRLLVRYIREKELRKGDPLLSQNELRTRLKLGAVTINRAVQALTEREVRNKMREEKLESIRAYPENREASHPTTSKVLDRFQDISTYKIMENSKEVETFKDSLNEDQRLILKLLNIGEEHYWKPHPKGD